jgi:hypothetical protein
MKNVFYRVGKGRAGGTGNEFMEPRGRWPENAFEPLQ